MPIRYGVEDETGIVVETHTGLITQDEWRAHVDRSCRDPALKRPVRILADHRLRESLPSAEELREIAILDTKLLGPRGHPRCTRRPRPRRHPLPLFLEKRQMGRRH